MTDTYLATLAHQLRFTKTPLFSLSCVELEALLNHITNLKEVNTDLHGRIAKLQQELHPHEHHNYTPG